MVWSGVAGPMLESAAASRDEANSSTSAASSKPTTTRLSRPTSPRSTGATASATRRRSSGEAVGAADQVDRGEVGVLHRSAPADGPVLLQEQRLRLGMPREGLGHLARDQEARTPVRQRDDVPAVDFAQ